MARTGIARPPVRRYPLKNGLTVALAPDPESPTVSVWVWYRVGSKNEHPGITGASHWVEHMLFQGSPRYGKGEIDRAVIEVGGTLNAFTDLDLTAYYITVPREHLSIPLDIESDRMTRATISDREVERERTVIHSEREGNENWPEFRVEEELYQLAYRVHPYRWDALGRREDIVGMSPAQLREYYHRFYGPRNALLVVAGGFDPTATSAAIERQFARLPSAGASVEITDVEPPARGERRAELSGPGTTPYVQIGWPAPAMSEESTAAALALDTILGGDLRMFGAGFLGGRGAEHPTSRLYRALVDPGIAVRATCDWRPRACPSLFTVQAQATEGRTADELERALIAAVDRLARDGPTPGEMAELRRKLERGAALAYEGASHVGFRLGYFWTMGGFDLESDLYRRIHRLRPPDLKRQARAMFQSDARVVVRYSPKGGPADD